jgi:hypothetical protein
MGSLMETLVGRRANKDGLGSHAVLRSDLRAGSPLGNSPYTKRMKSNSHLDCSNLYSPLSQLRKAMWVELVHSNPTGL